MKILKYVFALLIFFSAFLLAQDNVVKNNPGYFDFGDLSSFDNGEEGAEVNIEEHLIKMVAKMTAEEDKQLSGLLNGLKLIKVNTFQVDDKNRSAIKKKITSVQNSLSGSKWDKIARIREKGEDMSVFLKTDRNNKINGVVVAGIMDKGQAVFVNIVGDIDLEAIGKLGDKFDIPSLGDLHKKKNQE
jgi:hypothetical protein